MIRNDKGRGFVYGCIPLLVSDVTSFGVRRYGKCSFTSFVNWLQYVLKREESFQWRIK